MYIGGPFCGRLRLVKRLPGNRFPYFYSKSFAGVLVHLVGQIEHGYVELNAQPFANISQPIEKIGVLSAKMYGDDVALSFYALCDKGLLPLKVADDSMVAA